MKLVVRKAFSRVAMLAVLLFAAAPPLWLHAYMRGPGPAVQRRTVVIPRGSGAASIARTLDESGVITHPYAFLAMAWTVGKARAFKAGEYQFPAQTTPAQAMDMVAEGRTVVRKFTVAEGLTAREILDQLAANEALTGELPPDVGEGSLLPETYHYAYGDARAELVDRMQRAMRHALAGLWERRAPGLPLRTPRDALILASIVEKETGVADERGRVAAVFINRLRAGMKLQSDPTVMYAITSVRGPLKRALTTADLRTPMAYNTYTSEGLPPGPIANPGKAALEAVLNPPATDEYYFVASGKGGHRFAATLAEHNGNVRLYRAVLETSDTDASTEK